MSSLQERFNEQVTLEALKEWATAQLEQHVPSVGIARIAYACPVHHFLDAQGWGRTVVHHFGDALLLDQGAEKVIFSEALAHVIHGVDLTHECSESVTPENLLQIIGQVETDTMTWKYEAI